MRYNGSTNSFTICSLGSNTIDIRQLVQFTSRCRKQYSRF